MTEEQNKTSPYSGYILIALAALLMWLGGQLNNSISSAHHQILIAEAELKDSVFDETVILMLQHTTQSGLGLIVNKPGKGEFFNGGPVERDKKYYLLHSLDVVWPKSVIMKDMNLGVVEGGEDVKDLITEDKKPGWYRLVNGYSGWGKRQLARELGRGSWRIVRYDEKFVKETPPAEMWQKALKLPAVE